MKSLCIAGIANSLTKNTKLGLESTVAHTIYAITWNDTQLNGIE